MIAKDCAKRSSVWAAPRRCGKNMTRRRVIISVGEQLKRMLKLTSSTNKQLLSGNLVCCSLVCASDVERDSRRSSASSQSRAALVCATPSPAACPLVCLASNSLKKETPKSRSASTEPINLATCVLIIFAPLARFACPPRRVSLRLCDAMRCDAMLVVVAHSLQPICCKELPPRSLN